MTTDPGPARLGAWLGGTLVAAVVGALVLRSMFVAIPQSYDALLYGRSLWGMATGHAFNPVYGTHWLGVHANFVFFVLAPVARIVEPVAVLAVASAVSLGVTAGGAGLAAARGRGETSLAVSLAITLVVGLATPLVTNPFLFDARPEAIAVALLTLALLRARARGKFDRLALAGLVGASLVREEFAVVGASALVLAPLGWTSVRVIATRLGAASLLLAWAAAYVLWIRPAFDDGFSAERAQTAATELFGWGDSGTWRYRATLLLSLGLAGGGLVIRGFRWLGASLVGLAFCLAVDKSGAQAIRFHYLMLVAPGLVVALVDGFARSTQTTARALALAAAAGLGLTWHHGALPFTRTFDDVYFAVHDRSRLDDLADARAAVAAVPPDAGLAAPYIVASAEADRVTILSMETLARALRQHGALPPEIEFVALLGSDFSSLGRLLVHQQGLYLASYQPGQFALLTRRPVAQTERLPGIACPDQPPEPLFSWPELGVGIAADSNGVVLHRRARTGPIPALLPAHRGPDGVAVVPPLEGLIRLDDIPVGCSAGLAGEVGGDWVLVAPNGAVVEPRRGQGPEGATN